MKRSRSWSDWSLGDRDPSLKPPWRRQSGPEKCNGVSRRCLEEQETVVKAFSTENCGCDGKIIPGFIDSSGDDGHCSKKPEESSGEDHLAIEGEGKGRCNGIMEEQKLGVINPSLELEECLRFRGESSSEEKHQVLEDSHEVSTSPEVKEVVERVLFPRMSDAEKSDEEGASNLANASENCKEECEMKQNSSSDINRLENADANITNENYASEDHDLQSVGKEMSLEKGVKVFLLRASPQMETTLDLGLDVEKRKSTDFEEGSTEAEGFNLEMEQVPVILFGPCKEEGVRMSASGESTDEMTRNKTKGKRKSSEIYLSDEEESTDEDEARDGPSIIGNFKLVFRSNVSKPNKVLERERSESEPLDLALGLRCGSSGDHGTKSFSFCSDSAYLKASMSLSGLEALSHAASCCLLRRSVEGNEDSIVSHPKSQGTTQDARNENLKGEPSNGSKYKGIAASKRRISPTNGKSDRLKDGQEGTESACSPILSGTEKVLNKIVFEHLPIASRMIQEMSHQSITYLRESIGQMVINRDKHSLLAFLQDALKKRSDLDLDSLSKCHRVVLEILLTLKTGLPDFLLRAENVRSSDLAEIFLNLKCRNIACLGALPVDECNCTMCVLQNGFCSACMCLVCSSFDSACNTCGWVGCDVCLHWCHADCALKASHIRNGFSVSEMRKNPEMQFHCLACGHPSEMFGFVKEVFNTCSKDWSADVLLKELGHVSKVFSSSEDSRGKQLHNMANNLLEKLRNGALHSAILGHILSFLNGGGSKIPDESNEIVKEKHAMEDHSILRMAKHNPRPVNDLRINVFGKEPVIDELDDIVRLKEVEAKVYQKRSDDARREAERLKQICEAKSGMIEEDYLNELLRLQIPEIEKRRKLKIEQLRALEKAHSGYMNMKTRIEEGAKKLMVQMEANIQKFGL